MDGRDIAAGVGALMFKAIVIVALVVAALSLAIGFFIGRALA